MIYAMFAMVVLTFGIGCLAFYARVQSVRTRQVSPKYYRLMQGGELPEFVVKTTRSLNNQFEIPVLFYVVATLYVAVGASNSVALMLAWAFVVLRVVHAAIHLSYNHLMHRMSVFWVSNFVLLALWIKLVLLIHSRVP